MPYPSVITTAATVADGQCQEHEDASVAQDTDNGKPGLVFALDEQDQGYNLRLGFAEMKQGADLFGSTRRALDLDSGLLCLVTTLDVDNKARSETLSEDLARLQTVNHPNLVSMMSYKFEHDCIHLCLERVELGSVTSLIAELGPLNGRLLHKAIMGMLSGLSYLHACQPAIAHGDVRGDNILVDLDSTVKLTNFGLLELGIAPPVAADALAWPAPEVARGCKAVDRKKSDMWSVGCTMIELCAGERLVGQEATEKDIAIPPMPLGLQGLTSRCLRSAPALRPSAHELAVLFSRFVPGTQEEEEEQ